MCTTLVPLLNKEARLDFARKEGSASKGKLILVEVEKQPKKINIFTYIVKWSLDLNPTEQLVGH